jgi:TonB family protein
MTVLEDDTRREARAATRGPDGDAAPLPGAGAEQGFQPAASSFAAAIAADEAEERRTRWRRLVLLLVALPVLGGVGYLGWTLLTSGKSQPQRQVVNTVTRVTLPPPPPPPPPPKTDPPPEPVVQPRIQEQPLQRAEPPKPQPTPRPTPPAPGPPAGLGLPTGPGGANPYGIGPGGGDGSVIGGGGGGGGGARFGGYAGALQGSMQRALQRDERTRRGAWRVTVRLWIGPGGEISRAQLVGSSGDPNRDTAIQQVLTGLTVQPPPGDLPQPIVERIDSRA